MSKITKSMKRLYDKGLMSKEQIDKALSDGKITRAEYDYILEIVEDKK